ncbi:MAG: hypothetical protein IH631_04150, partial [Candidatus Thorarchaeota archaeon]|nr:hypothetical protein [Candidatus Thorarchaeota archaeon]
MKRNNVSKILLFGLMFLLIASLSPATTFALSEDDDTTSETEDDTDSMHMMDDDMGDMHEIDEHRDSEGTVWIEADVMTVTLAPNMAIYQYWFAGDENGSLARFMVG